jgi:hypothetical protein
VEKKGGLCLGKSLVDIGCLDFAFWRFYFGILEEEARLLKLGGKKLMKSKTPLNLV